MKDKLHYYNWDPSKGDFDRTEIDKEHSKVREKMVRDRILLITSITLTIIFVVTLIFYFAE
ncbi:MAG: hypothetical protein WBP57_08340 [Ignavibacteria bacterium]|jgi:hypothetical protein|nr:MAG: hypothetical protein EDM69_01640 [Chlorobiota bacterium]KXK01603.1 MAG: hypothetical protein UZ04_CHB001002173 [Chlorobi bacterium OLB4]MBV6398627.1 hypothetical protein [Ignavibacteria bacterium]MCE7952005.1 hypothetical protein [Chlorobi bacterium CHB7]OQY77706.1 MAG: hypothetical protein B6D43_04150 [Ignavibacteriales bacterium UTCHB1]RIK48882.1 MAG: hypothetical protein DCC60_06205 [Ignavibacteriota bacterium]